MGRAEQIERRRRRGRSESYEIEHEGDDPIRSRYRVRGSSGRAYEVVLWEPGAQVHYCSCPDFDTNALGTCKHVEAVLHHLTEQHAEAFAEAQEAPPQAPLVYLDTTASPPVVRLLGMETASEQAAPHLEALFAPPAADKPAKASAKKSTKKSTNKSTKTTKTAKTAKAAKGAKATEAGADEEPTGNGAPAGQTHWSLRAEADRKAVDQLFSDAEELGIRLAPSVQRFVERQRERQDREADLAEASQTFAAWRETLLARQQRGEKPDPDDEARATWVKRFGDLEPWAADGAAHLVRQGRALLADEPELDKLRQTLAATEFFRLTGRAQKILVACPASRRHLWRAAIRMRSGLEPRIIGGVTFEELARSEAKSAYCVVTFNRLYRNLDKLQATDWDVLVLDEVQRIKSWPAPTGRAIKSLQTSYAFALSSGHLEQRPADYFYTIQLLDPYLLGPAWRFLEQHVVRDARGAAVGVEKMDQAVEASEPLWLRRSGDELSLSGPARRLELFVDVTHSQHRQIDPVLRTLLAMTRTDKEWTHEQRQELISLLERLRTVCTAPELIKPNHPGSPKLDELTHLVEELCCGSGRRVTVFCRQDSLSEVVAQRLSPLAAEIHTLEANQSLAARKKRIKQLAAAEQPTVLVISDAAASGLDLTPLTEVAIHAELPWQPARFQKRRESIGAETDGGCLLELQLLCTSTPEQAAAEALRRRADHLGRLVTDPELELESLLEAEEWQLRELIGLVVDERMVLRPKKALLSGKPVTAPARPFTLRGLKQKERIRKGQAPQQRYLLGEGKGAARAAPAQGTPARSAPAQGAPAHGAPPRGAAARGAPAPGAPQADRPVRATLKRRPAAQPVAPAQPRPGAQAQPQAGDILVLGLETREDRLTCSQPSKVHTLGLAMAVTYSFRAGRFTAWRGEFINDLVRTLVAARLVVAYNPLGFEYKVLGPYTGRNLGRIPTVDLMLEITKAVGKKLPFDLITGPTLERGWSADRSQASAHFQAGESREVAGLCTESVKVVRDLFLHGAQHGEVRYQRSPSEDPQPLRLDLRTKLDDEALEILGLS